MERTYSAAVIVIGNEVLTGRIQDVNVQFIATELKGLGIGLEEVRIVADVESAIVDAVNALRARVDYVFTTGGIGPTHDDITAACVARALGVPLEQRPEARAILEDYYGDDINDARLRMANIPAGAALLDNPVSRAPGFQTGNVFVLPGVPRIMQAMFDGFKNRLAGGRPMLSKSVNAFVAESKAAPGLVAILARHEGVEIGSYPYTRRQRFGTVLVIRSLDAALLDTVTGEVAEMIRALGAEPEVLEGEATVAPD